MKSLKGIFVSLIGAGALVVAVSPARAVLSDDLSLFDAAGVMLATVSASEAQEAGNANPLFSFDHNYSNPAFVGHYIAIMEPDGTVSDVVGVDNEGGLFPNHMAFISGDGAVTAAQLAFAGFLFLDATYIETAGGITLDSRTNPFLATYINPATAPAGSYLIFNSDGDAVPDGGSAVALLGIALAAVEGVRRVLGSRKA